MSTLVRWNPIREMAAMQNAMDRVFNDAVQNSRNYTQNGVLALDVFEVDEAYHVTANLPGVEEENIKINIHDGVLTINAEVLHEEIDENTRILLSERSYGKFSRSVTLPQPIATDDVEATYEDGILGLVLPKVPEVQPKSIPVKRLQSGK